MRLITRSQLREARNTFEKSQKSNALNEVVNLMQTRSSRYGEVTVFLSHKHDDVDDFENAIALLKSKVDSIYVDWMDKDMPKTTSGVTASKLKKKISENKKFIFLATENAINSTWCNWELGLGDAAKYIDNIALLVVKDDNGNWTGNEYLQIYPIIVQTYHFIGFYKVEYPNGNTIDLEDWLKK